MCLSLFYPSLPTSDKFCPKFFFFKLCICVYIPTHAHTYTIILNVLSPGVLDGGIHYCRIIVATPLVIFKREMVTVRLIEITRVKR